MRRNFSAAFLVLACLAVPAGAHDLFMKLDTYFLRPNTKATVSVMNGTFRRSDGAVARERMRDVSVVSPAGVSHPPDSAWRDDGKTTLLDIEIGAAGTYVVGLSTNPREIDLKAKDFNEYLAHDGLPDTLAARKRKGELGRDVRERYSKHVRGVFQVGRAHRRLQGAARLPRGDHPAAEHVRLAGRADHRAALHAGG